jgi:hypothetical protein
MRVDEHTTYNLSVLFAKLGVSSKGKLGTKVSMCMCCRKDRRARWCGVVPCRG